MVVGIFNISFVVFFSLYFVNIYLVMIFVFCEFYFFFY